MKTAIAIIFSLTYGYFHAQNNKAFIVGISNYEKSDKGWDNISGYEDALHIQSFLISSLGFNVDDVVMVNDTEASKDKVLKSFKKFAKSINESTEFVFIYFATHGQQITDSNKDETLDQLDEALAMYDTPFLPKYTASDYKGEKHLIDDDIAPILIDIRKRIAPTGHVFMGVDACFSATSDKADTNIPIRGTHKKFLWSEDKIEKLSDTTELGELSIKNDSLAPFVILSASQADKANLQHSHSIGSLTFGLTEAYKKLDNVDISYESFFKLVDEEFKEVKRLNFGQNPVLAGNKEQSIFKSGYINNHPYFVTAYNDVGFSVGENPLDLPYGKIHGYAPGTIFKIVSRKNDSLIGYGKIENANEVRSNFSCSIELSSLELNNAIFIPVQMNYCSSNFRVNLTKRQKRKYEDFLLKKSTIELHDENSDFNVTELNGLLSVKYINSVIIEDVPIENLEYALIYASFYDYLIGLDKLSRKEVYNNKPLETFEIVNAAPNEIVIHSKGNDYFYNVGILKPKFTVIYPNSIYKNNELYLSTSSSYKSSYPISKTVNEKLILILEQNRYTNTMAGDYFPNLSLDKSIFTSNFFKLKEDIPSHLKFNSTKENIEPQNNFSLLIID